MLKYRWQSLRELRILIKDERSAARANLWIQACIVLHDYLVDICDDSNVVMLAPEVGGQQELLEGLIEEEAEEDVSGLADDSNARRNYVYDQFRTR